MLGYGRGDLADRLRAVPALAAGRDLAVRYKATMQVAAINEWL
jgi:hypothetical protein